MKDNLLKIGVVYSHHKLGDLIWQLPYIESISAHYSIPVTLITRPKTQAKDILQDEKFIKEVFYCKFRKKIFYFCEILKLYLFFKREKFSHIFILDKISRPAIAAKLAKIKNIIGPGIGSQKKWITSKSFLNSCDYANLNYSEQSAKLLKLNDIIVRNKIPKISIQKETLERIELNFVSDIKNHNAISLGVDSFEYYKMWYEEQFAELANILNEKKIANKFFLIASPQNSHIVKRIIEISKKNIFVDCSYLNLLQIIKVIKLSSFYIGNNSGPLNLSSALNVKSYGLIANDKVSELKNSNILPILPDNYKNEFYRNRSGMKRLTVTKVLNHILHDLDSPLKNDKTSLT